MNRTKLRIVQDYVNFNEDKPEGIYLYIDKDNIFNQYALIIGPKNTPYFGGFFFFEIKYPKNYPNNPPSINMLTIDKDVRFNPNLYENGKVCLSILGTWTGPSWEKIMDIKSVLLSIQSLMNEVPIRNEPGYEDIKQESKKSIDYNHYITYYNYKIAVNDILNKFNLKKKNYDQYLDFFKENIIYEFKKNYKTLLEDLKSYMITIGEKEVGKIIYFIRKKHLLDFIKLKSTLEETFKLFSQNYLKKNEFNLV